MGYREDGIGVYGDKCELCGHGLVEVHHIDYQEHQEIEDMLRYLSKYGNDITELLAEAKSKGYLYWSGHQLSKDDLTRNLSVLCPNCHTLVHRVNMGKKLLRVLPKRI